MIDALSLEQVNMKTEPHHTHRFSEWKDTMVSCASNDRFGSMRKCQRCGCIEVFAGGGGSHYFDGDAGEPCHDY